MASIMRFDQWEDSNGVPVASAANGVGAFNASTTITATDATWSVPTLASPIVKVTCSGGGGGASEGGTLPGNGGTTTFNAGGAGTVTANGGVGGKNSGAPRAANIDFRAGNGGPISNFTGNANFEFGQDGEVKIAYLNLAGISTVNITIGSGGTAPSASSAGGRGEVIVEYVAA
jgi:hypothetical protein